MAMRSSSPPNPPPTAAAAATPRLFPIPPTAVTKTPIHHFSPSHRKHNYPNILPRVSQATQGIPYHLPSSTDREFLSRAISSADPDGYPPRPYSTTNPARVPFGMHIIGPIHMQHGSSGVVVKGIPISSHPKVAASPSSVSDYNGYNNTRRRTRDDSFVTVRERKVRITYGASLYAQCRSWLRNGLPEDSQPQYLDGVKSLPRPFPMPVGDIHSPQREEDDKEEEDEGDVEHICPKELLRLHIKHAKGVRARLREERLQRIARYKTRLALLLPPIVEQQLRNDTAAGT